MELRPHDLVRFSGALTLPASAPAWVHRALAAFPWAVVRRARPAAGNVAVGARGDARADRYAFEADGSWIAAVATPEMLAGADARGERARLPALRALPALREAAHALGIRWGPAGSVGFELATGMPAVGSASDCDIVVRAQGAGRARLHAFADAVRALDVRIDATLEFAAGGVALDEYVRSARPLVKTCGEPRFADPSELE